MHILLLFISLIVFISVTVLYYYDEYKKNKDIFKELKNKIINEWYNAEETKYLDNYVLEIKDYTNKDYELSANQYLLAKAYFDTHYSILKEKFKNTLMMKKRSIEMHKDLNHTLKLCRIKGWLPKYDIYEQDENVLATNYSYYLYLLVEKIKRFIEEDNYIGNRRIIVNTEWDNCMRTIQIYFYSATNFNIYITFRSWDYEMIKIDLVQFATTLSFLWEYTNKELYLDNVTCYSSNLYF